LPFAAAAALVSTAGAQEPGDQPCQLSSLVLLSSAPPSAEAPPVRDVAFPPEACLFLETSFNNVFDLGFEQQSAANPVSGLDNEDCSLQEVADDLAAQMPALAGLLPPAPDVSLSQEACETLRLVYSLLAVGELTPLSPSALDADEGAGPPLNLPTSIPSGDGDADDSDANESDAADETIAADLAASSAGDGCLLSDLLASLYAEAPALAGDEPLPADALSAEACGVVTALFEQVAVIVNDGAAPDESATPEEEPADADEPAEEGDETTVPAEDATPEGEPAEEETEPDLDLTVTPGTDGDDEEAPPPPLP
jgi:hypothetical protein